MDFGKKLRELRKNKEMTSSELSKKANVSQSYLSQLETGKNKNPTPDILRRLAKGLNVSYFELMKVAGYGDKENPIPSDSFYDLIHKTPSEIESRIIILDKVLKDKAVKVYYKDKLISEDEKENINQLIDIHLKGR